MIHYIQEVLETLRAKNESDSISVEEKQEALSAISQMQANLDKLKQDPAAIRLSQSRDELEQRTFTYAGLSCNSDLLQLSLRKADSVQYEVALALFADLR